MTHKGLTAALLALTVTLGAAPASLAADAFFPGDAPPPTQVTRDLTLKEAAQRGLIKLAAKGLGGEGDAVSLELQHKKVRGPITVTVRVEFTVKPRVSAELREAVANTVQDLAGQTEARLNRGFKTKGGDPISFKLEFAFRAPEAEERFNYHQVLVINPTVDLDEPNPNYRSNVTHLGTPNKFGEQSGGTFAATGLNPTVLSHELLHLAGLGDRYADFYRVRGKDYPLPAPGMKPSDLKAFLKAHRPPLPAPPAGRTLSKNVPGTERCDIMGENFQLDCRKISRRDLDWFESQAGVQVTAQPGDLLLNKDASRQNMGVGFQTMVYAPPGSTTTANGISAYCIDKDRLFPSSEGFDVLGSARDLPGYAGAGTPARAEWPDSDRARGDTAGDVARRVERDRCRLTRLLRHGPGVARAAGPSGGSRELGARRARIPAEPQRRLRGNGRGDWRRGAAGDREQADQAGRRDPARVRPAVSRQGARRAQGADGHARVHDGRRAHRHHQGGAPCARALAQGALPAAAQGAVRPADSPARARAAPARQAPARGLPGGDVRAAVEAHPAARVTGLASRERSVSSYR